MLKPVSPGLIIKISTAFLFLLAFTSGNTRAGENIIGEGQKNRLRILAERRLEKFEDFFVAWRHVGVIGIDSISIDGHSANLNVYFNPTLTHLPIRHDFIRKIEYEITYRLGRRFRKFNLQLFCRNRPLNDFIPNALKQPYLDVDPARVRRWPNQSALVNHLSKGYYAGGLSGSHIALWPSHGMFFNNSLSRWQWQRARLFGTVEDLFPMIYIIQYLAPMLENAGAVVLLPRERDFQKHEVLVDLDGSTGNSELILNVETNNQIEILPGGFARTDTLFDGENPFKQGNHLRIVPQTENTASIKYIPEFPIDGYYAVYFSWQHNPLNSDVVEAELKFSGGFERFLLNQTMGGGTWVYLGTYFFRKGKNAPSGSFEIFGNKHGAVTADALRLGGGMGNIARRTEADVQPRGQSAEDSGQLTLHPASMPGNYFAWSTSGRPRYMEGARYYLQYAGMPGSLVYNLNSGRNDYNDDFMSRGEWVNYLLGSPLGPTAEPGTAGLNIPIDLALAFHTDAGITPNDSVIGTLAIYSTQRNEGLFRDGVSKLASRDLSDLIQSRIVNDIRHHFNENWTRRALWDRQYSEAWRPQVPAMLLELLSHQNLADMRYGLDPRFQAGVSRAIYKGILDFLVATEGRQAIILPLPVQAMMIERICSKKIRISWKPTPDPLEPSAMPQNYKVYKKTEGQGFDTGTLTTNNFFEVELPHWNTIYSFRVTALNQGGESFPSETLSVALVEDQPKTVLVVNAFTRISGPSFFDNNTMAGLAWWQDQGVPFHYNTSYTGHQYDFNRHSPWLHDDSPGWGASHADMEELKLIGNTFNFPEIHGASIRDAGYSFISVSRKAIEDNNLNPSGIWAASIIMGEQLGVANLKDTSLTEFRVFTPELINWIIRFTAAGGHVFVSGAYLATDMIKHHDTLAKTFSAETLGFVWRTNHAANKPEIIVTDQYSNSFPNMLYFNNKFHPCIYIVEAPDGIEPASEKARTLFRYGVNQISAAVIFSGNHKAVSLGFPFEAIADLKQRQFLMKSILNYFEK